MTCATPLWFGGLKWGENVTCYVWRAFVTSHPRRVDRKARALQDKLGPPLIKKDREAIMQEHALGLTVDELTRTESVVFDVTGASGRTRRTQAIQKLCPGEAQGQTHVTQGSSSTGSPSKVGSVAQVPVAELAGERRGRYGAEYEAESSTFVSFCEHVKLHVCLASFLFLLVVLVCCTVTCMDIDVVFTC